MLQPNTNYESNFWKPRMQFKMTSYSVRTLMQTAQQIDLCVYLSLNIDVYFLSKIRIQDSNEVPHIHSPSV